MKLAIIKKEDCKPGICNSECKRFCPIEKKEKDSCVTISEKAKIDERTCIGCSICVKRCPFQAIDIVNLPTQKENEIIHRYGPNGFVLYGLPTIKEGKVLGLLGRNGIGKSTAIKIISGQERINLGKEYASDEEIKKFFAGNETIKFIESIKNGKKVSYKPQNISKLSSDVLVIDLLKKRGTEEEINNIILELDIKSVLNNKLKNLSGGELQKVAIAAASLGESDIYLYDEPLAFLDISERIKISDFLRKKALNKTMVVIEHDLLVLDYLTDYISIFYGVSGVFGKASGIKSSRNAVNSYLKGYIKEENMLIRDKELSFNFTKNYNLGKEKLFSWPYFKIELESGFKLEVLGGTINRGNTIGILGKNGTGKTTFVKALAGLIKTSNGKIETDLKISYKPQYLDSDEESFVREILFKEKIDKKMRGLFNLDVLESKKASNLSGGELQRLSIARCLSKDADIYLIDEPSAYLDVEERISCAKAIKDIIVEKEKTAFIVDHDLLLISYLADSIIHFSGEKGIYGKASEIKAFEEGLKSLLKDLDITLRKDEESGRPRINNKGSFLDREQKKSGQLVII